MNFRRVVLSFLCFAIQSDIRWVKLSATIGLDNLSDWLSILRAPIASESVT